MHFRRDIRDLALPTELLRVACGYSMVFFIIIKAFLTFTYKIEIKKKKKERRYTHTHTHTHTHAYIVQIEEYKAKHTQSYYSNSYLYSM